MNTVTFIREFPVGKSIQEEQTKNACDTCSMKGSDKSCNLTGEFIKQVSYPWLICDSLLCMGNGVYHVILT